MPVWVTRAVVLAIHGEQLAEHGGSDGLRDAGALDAALARPLNLLLHAPEGADPPDLAALAACYGYGLCQNHPFVDGNKRVSFVVTELFLALNGYELELDDFEAVSLWLALAARGIGEAELAARLRRGLQPVE